MRLARYIAHCGVASRRHAERLITSGHVGVDGERVVDPARDVGDENLVTVDGRRIEREAFEYHLLHKPLGVVSTAHDPEGRQKVVDLVPSSVRLYPVGRLDADTSGLVILTNDGDLANRLTHPRYEVEKTYRALVEGKVGKRALARLQEGVQLDDGRTAPAKARIVWQREGEALLELVIYQGRKRQVRRMGEAVGHPVIGLQRVAYGPLVLRGLAPGDSRPLGPAEVEELRRAGRL